MASKKLLSGKKIGSTSILGLAIIIFLAISLIVGVFVATSNKSLNPNKQARECECDQYNQCDINYKCSNQTCGTCISTLKTKPPVGDTGGGGTAPRTCKYNDDTHWCVGKKGYVCGSNGPQLTVDCSKYSNSACMVNQSGRSFCTNLSVCSKNGSACINGGECCSGNCNETGDGGFVCVKTPNY